MPQELDSEKEKANENAEQFAQQSRVEQPKRLSNAYGIFQEKYTNVVPNAKQMLAPQSSHADMHGKLNGRQA